MSETLNVNLLPLMQKYFEDDPIIAANHLETLEPKQLAEIFSHLPQSLAAKLLTYMNEVPLSNLVFELPPVILRTFVDKLDNQRSLNLSLTLPQDKQIEFIELLSDKKKKQLYELLQYPEDSAGRSMTTRFTSFPMQLKVKDAVKKIRDAAKKDSSLSYVYVVDNDKKLAGVLNMRDLLLATDTVTLETVMRKNVFSINCFEDRETIAQELSHRKLFSAPVVNSENQLLGIVKAEQLITGIQKDATEDLQKMFGAGGNEKAFSPMGYSLKRRLPWLHINLVTAFMAATVVAAFEGVIAKITILAVFLPVVAGQGGNAGAQSLAVVMRGLVMREIPTNKIKTLLFKETWIGLINGIIIGLVTAAIAWLWKGNAFLGLVIGLGMIVNLFAAGLAGSSIPLIMKALGLDPAQASNIILTTVTDIVGFFAFLGFALIFQNHLL